jgi:site-specific DNA-methyltransferase (adenine-specific)
MTSHDLVPAWERALRLLDRYVFAPVPYVETGSRVRLAGDGPSSWTVWLVVARPRTQAMARWGTLPGAYVLPSERGKGRIGGKALAGMRAIVRDYTRPGDLVVDPCAGAGTTLRACQIEGRRAIGAEMDLRAYRVAADRLRGVGPTQNTIQPSLFGVARA